MGITADSKGKYQPWSHEEFMADRRVRRMSPLAVKTYMMLLHEAFVCAFRPNLPDDEEELELMAYCSDHEEWLSVRDTVLGMFDKTLVKGVPVLVNKRLVRDWEHLQEIREIRSEAGKAGAKSRWDSKNGKPMANDSTPVAKNSKEVSKEVSKESEEKEESETDSLSFEDDGQGETMKLKTELTKIAAQHRAKAGGYKTTWDEIKTLGVAHGTYAVSTDFSAYMEEYHGDDFPSGAVVSYLRVAQDRLTAPTAPAAVVSKDPRIVALDRELVYLSGDRITFHGKHKVAMSLLLEEYSLDELAAVFKTFIGDKNLEDAYTLKYIAQNYLDAADSLANSARRRKQEAEKEKSLRAAAVERLQEEAEVNRQAAEKLKQAETELFNPFA